MRQWRKDGIAIGDAELCNLAAHDCEAFCELNGVRLRFTAETIDRHPSRRYGRQASTMVLTLRQVGGPQIAGPIHLVDFAEASPLSSASCEGRRCGQLDDARALADRTARRYVCAELFRKAGEMIAGDEAA